MLGNSITHVILNLRLGNLAWSIRLQLHIGPWFLLSIDHRTDNTCIRNIIMLKEYSFQLRGCNLKSINLDEFLLAIDNPEHIIANNDNIPCFEPSLRVKAFTRSLFIFPVAHADIGTPDIKFTRLTGRDRLPVIVENLAFAVGV